MIRIVQTTPAVAIEDSGPTYSVVRLCESLIATGADVKLAAMDWAPLPSSPAFLRAFPIGVGPRRLGRAPKMRRWLEEESRAGRIDLLHNHGMWQMNAVYPGRVAARYRLPYVVSPRGSWSQWAMANGSWLKKPFWSLAQRPSLTAVSCFHATAHNEREEIRRLGFRQPVAVIPNGIDIPPLQAKPKGGPRTLLFLGRVHPKKGVDLLLRAWAAIQSKFPDWCLRIVGSDDGYHGPSGYLSEMRELSRSRDLRRLEFAGVLTGAAKLKAYADAELFVLPTHSENFGMSVAEALAAGTPAIVSKGAPWSGLNDYDAGRWIDIGVDPLVAALEDLLQSEPSTLQEMGRRGRDWMVRDFSWDRVGWQMSEVYRWLCGPSFPVPLCVSFD